MICPNVKCHSTRNKVTDSRDRPSKDRVLYRWRKRKCDVCGTTWETREYPQQGDIIPETVKKVE